MKVNTAFLKRFCAAACAGILLGSLSACGEPITSPDPAAFSITEVTAETTITTEATTARYRTEDTVNNGKIIQNVPHYSQLESYLTACETLAAVSLLQYYDIEITPDEFIGKYLPVADYPHWEAYDNQLHGESPWQYFLGDPMAQNAYGCYNTVIAKALNQITDGLAKPLNDVPLDQLCSTYIDNAQPVILWATMDMAETHDGNSWILPTGEKFTFICPEHALLLIGYDDENYYFSDSLHEEDVYSYDKASVETAYAAMHSMSVVISPNPDILCLAKANIEATEQPQPAVEPAGSEEEPAVEPAVEPEGSEEEPQ